MDQRARKDACMCKEGPIGHGMINGKNHDKKTVCFCSIWQLVKNWLDGNERNHISRQYSPRIWTIPSDKTAKSWKFMILDITMIFKTINK